MKDIVHHLRHIQKKVISSSRKADYQNQSVASSIPKEIPPLNKKKVFNSHMR